MSSCYLCSTILPKPKNDDLHTKQLKEHMSNGGTKHAFKEKVHPKIFDGCIKAKPLKMICCQHCVI